MGLVILGFMDSRRFVNIAKALPLVLTVIAFSDQAAAGSYRSTNPALVSRAEQVTGDRFPVVMTTPLGVTVFARTTPRADLLKAIDRGFAELFAVAQRHGYRNRLRFDDYTVFVGAPTEPKIVADNIHRTSPCPRNNTPAAFMTRVGLSMLLEWCWPLTRLLS